MQLTKEQIVKEIAESERYYESCIKTARKGRRDDLAGDLYQEFILTLFEYKAETIEGIHSRGEMKWFCCALIHMMFHSKTSPFYRKFRFRPSTKRDISIEQFEELMNYKDEWINHTVLNSGVMELIEEILFIADDGYDFDEDAAFELMEAKIHNDENSDSWYRAKLMNEYLTEGSSRKLSKKTGIAYRSIAHTIQLYKKEIGDNLDSPVMTEREVLQVLRLTKSGLTCLIKNNKLKQYSDGLFIKDDVIEVYKKLAQDGEAA